MSKTLSKVLVICALVIILPLMIVGTGFAAYYSVESVVNLAVVVDFKSPAEDVHAFVSYKGNAKEEMKITEGHMSNVKVSADYSAQAYKFVGWFEGTAESYKAGQAKLVEENSDFTISMKEGGNYVAAYEVVKYYVDGWRYTEAPSDLINVVNEAPEGAKGEGEFYVYGEVLPELSYQKAGYDYDFDGWMIDEDETTVEGVVPTYKAATFATSSIADNGSVKLIGAWSEGKTAISYTANINADVETLKAGEESTTVDFTVEDLSAFETYLNNVETKYSFWTVEGIKYNETVYGVEELDTLATAYAEDSDNDVTGEFALVVKKNLTNFTIEDVEFKGADRSYQTAENYTEDVNSAADWDSTITLSTKVVDAATTDSSKTINSWLNINENTQLQLRYINGERVNVNIERLALENAKVTINGTTYDLGNHSIALDGNGTLNDLIENILAYLMVDEEIDFNDVDNISITADSTLVLCSAM